MSGRTGEPLTLKNRDPRRWPDNPFLYNPQVTVGHDRAESYFGMRYHHRSPR
ncbi:glycoside hydrolase family 2 [Streptomyces violaceorubidus]